MGSGCQSSRQKLFRILPPAAPVVPEIGVPVIVARYAFGKDDLLHMAHGAIQALRQQLAGLGGSDAWESRATHGEAGAGKPAMRIGSTRIPGSPASSLDEQGTTSAPGAYPRSVRSMPTASALNPLAAFPGLTGRDRKPSRSSTSRERLNEKKGGLKALADGRRGMSKRSTVMACNPGVNCMGEIKGAHRRVARRGAGTRRTQCRRRDD